MVLVEFKGDIHFFISNTIVVAGGYFLRQICMVRSARVNQNVEVCITELDQKWYTKEEEPTPFHKIHKHISTTKFVTNTQSLKYSLTVVSIVHTKFHVQLKEAETE